MNQIEILKQKLVEAIAEQDYGKASDIRDEIRKTIPDFCLSDCQL